MIEGRSGAGFAFETIERAGVAGEVVGKEFQGDEAAEFRVLGLVDHAHPAAEPFDDAAGEFRLISCAPRSIFARSFSSLPGS